MASPGIGDANFERTVILMLEHTPQGALGVVLNRPLDAEVHEMLDAWAALAASPSVFFQGGPVALDNVIALAETTGATTPGAGWSPVLGTVGTVDLNRSPDDIGVVLRRVRLFAGYAGWGAGQLEGELGLDAWFVLDARADDAFHPDPDDLWYLVVGRQPPPLRWLRHFPPDPSVN